MGTNLPRMKSFSWYDRVSKTAARGAGRSITFTLACGVILIWIATGPLFHYSDTWQLAINTATTIITFLMVFLIQHTQNKDTEALQINLGVFADSAAAGSTLRTSPPSCSAAGGVVLVLCVPSTGRFSPGNCRQGLGPSSGGHGQLLFLRLPVLVQREQVVPCTNQVPFSIDLLQAPQQEAAQASGLLDLAIHRFDDRLALGVDR